MENKHKIAGVVIEMAPGRKLENLRREILDDMRADAIADRARIGEFDHARRVGFAFGFIAGLILCIILNVATS